MMAQAQASELSKRVATGVVGGAVLLALLIWGGRIGTAFVALVLSLGMIYEFIEITFSLPDLAEKRYVLMGGTWLIAFADAVFPGAEYGLVLATFLMLFAYFLFTAGRHRDEDFTKHFQELIYSVFGMLYLVFIPLFLPVIRDSNDGVHWIILFLIINWAGDTGAYFAGKKYGKKKLYPVISPKKTVEGSIGGLACGLVLSLAYKFALFHSLSVGAVIFVSLVVGAIAQIGDLGESFLKRAFNKKDSGSILPGHGGFMDRFDGVVFSLPVAYAFVRLLGY